VTLLLVLQKLSILHYFLHIYRNSQSHAQLLGGPLEISPLL